MAITPLSYDQLDEAILSYPAGVPAPEDWDVVLSFRSVKALGINSKFPLEMPLEEKIDSIIYNNNITIPLQQLLEAMTEEELNEEDAEYFDKTSELIAPLRFDDWDNNMLKYMGMVESDVKFMMRTEP